MLGQLATKIKREYPDAVRAAEQDSENYCVLGACYRYVRHRMPGRFRNYVRVVDGVEVNTPNGELTEQIKNFPDEVEAGKLLRMLNPNLNETKAEEFAANITEYNDDGDFAWAWQELKDALNFKG